MLDKKSLTWFLLITFGISWILFTLPLAFKNNDALYPGSLTLCFALGMWGPGIGAIAATVLAKQPFTTLRLNHLGAKRFYFWAWFLPPLLTALTFGFSLLLGTGQYDPNMTFLRELIKQAPATQEMPPVETIVLIQMVSAVTVAPLLNILFAMGEELGWRGFLLPKLLPLGQWKAILLTGFVWGLWHAPTTLFHGHNFPQHPYLGVLVMTVGCILLGVIFGWLYIKTQSPWAPALAHGAFNAVAGFNIYFLKPEGLDMALAANPLGVAGWLAMALVIGGLLLTRQLTPEESPPEPQAA